MKTKLPMTINRKFMVEDNFKITQSGEGENITVAESLILGTGLLIDTDVFNLYKYGVKINNYFPDENDED